jgi:hypothetical protein
VAVAVGLRGYGMCQMYVGFLSRIFVKMRRASCAIFSPVPRLFFQSPSCHRIANLYRWTVFVSRTSVILCENQFAPTLWLESVGYCQKRGGSTLNFNRVANVCFSTNVHQHSFSTAFGNTLLGLAIFS